MGKGFRGGAGGEGRWRGGAALIHQSRSQCHVAGATEIEHWWTHEVIYNLNNTFNLIITVRTV